MRVAILGAGFSGIGAAYRLTRAGYDDVVIFERDAGVGGTWRANTYPGVACDIPAHLYSFSFAPKHDWSTAYPRQDEILDYLDEVVDRFGLRSLIRLNTEVVEARFDEGSGTWTLRTGDGAEEEFDVVVAGLGPLREPSYPEIEGRDRFAGVQMHTARWDHSVALEGRRVGVVGTGSSGVQTVPPVADRAGHLTVCQRSAPWIIPIFDREYSRLERAILRWVPGARWLYRTILYWQKEARVVGFRRNSLAMRLMEAYARWNLRRHVRDPELRRKLEPDYRMGCKRIILSNRFYRAVASDHVDLVTDPIARVTERGIELLGGVEIPLDVIVWATGFDVRNLLGDLTVTGIDGRDLDKAWSERPAAYLGTTVPGFPNLFFLLGPNTGLGHNSVVFMAESQYDYIIDAIGQIAHPDVAYVDVREEALLRFQDEVTRRTRGMVWASGCMSWYLGEDGYNFTLWPGSTVEYRLRTRSFDPRSYRVVRRAADRVGRAA